ncbi:MAG: phosphoribosylglycinamide formyltransferase [bacterium]|nr:phosphoribosylglycinamide formyltransferase [bacterium]
MFNRKVKVAFFASGRGTNVENLLRAIQNNLIHAEPTLLISDREAQVEKLSSIYQIPCRRLSKKDYATLDDWKKSLIETVDQFQIDFIFLCGFLQLIPKALCERFQKRIVNIHPAPLPKFGGKGMYGYQLHKTVLESKLKWSGPTIHYVNEEYDKGEIIYHVPVPILPNDTPDSLAERVLKMEHLVYPVIAAQLIQQLYRD